MRIKMNIIIAIMITFCFTVSLFLIIPIRSSFNPYDPMLDYNHDGKISLADLVQFAASYGTTGDPTINVNVTNNMLMVNGTDNQNVTVTNPTYSLQTGTMNLTSNGGGYEPLIYCGGYSRLSVMLRYDTSVGVANNFTIYLWGIYWQSNNSFYSPLSWEFIGPNGLNISQAYPVPAPYMTVTKAPICTLDFLSDMPHTAWWVTFDYAVYLRNE